MLLLEVLRGVVADLLERGQQLHDHAASLDALALPDDGHRLVHRGLVEGGLLPGEGHGVVGLGLRRQLGRDPRVGLLAPQQERPHQRRQPGDRRLVAAVLLLLVLHGAGVAGPEGGQRPQQPRRGPVEERPQLGEVVLHRGAGQRHPGRGRDGAQGLRRRRVGVLDVLRLVGDDHAPGLLGEQGGAGAHRRVGGEDEPALAGRQVLGAAAAAVEAAHGGAGGELLDLPLPVAQEGGGAHHEGRLAAAAVQVQRDEGDGLAQAHVVGEAAAEPEGGHQVEPGQAARLVVAQDGLEPGGLREGGELGRQPFPQGGQGAHRYRLDGLAVDLGRPRQGGGQRVDRVQQAELPFACLAHQLRVDPHPLVPQPYDGPVGLCQRVHLPRGEPVSSEGQFPGEGEEVFGVEEGGPVGGGPGRGGPHDGGRGQRTGQVAGPVDDDPGGRQPVRGRPQQVLQLRVGQRQGVGDGLVQQPQQGRPDACGPAQREHGVDAGARTEAGPGRAGPQLCRVGDERGIGEAVDLDDGGAGPPGVLRLGLVEEAEGGQVEPEREPDSGVGAGRDLGGPLLYPGHPLRLPRGERPPRGHRRRRGAGQAVGDGVDERPDQCLRFGQLERSAPGEGGRVPLVGQGGGDRPEVGDVVGVERARAPCVDAFGGEPGQQPAARGQGEGLRGGGPPGPGGEVRGGAAWGSQEQGQGVGDGERHRGHGPAADPAAVRTYDGERTGCARFGEGVPVGRPEGDPPLPGDGGGQEDGGMAQQRGRLRLRLRLRRLWLRLSRCPGPCLRCHALPLPQARPRGAVSPLPTILGAATDNAPGLRFHRAQRPCSRA